MKTYKVEINETEKGKQILINGKEINLDNWDRKTIIESGLNQYDPEDIATFLEWKQNSERHTNL